MTPAYDVASYPCEQHGCHDAGHEYAHDGNFSGQTVECIHFVILLLKQSWILEGGGHCFRIIDTIGFYYSHLI